MLKTSRCLRLRMNSPMSKQLSLEMQERWTRIQQRAYRLGLSEEETLIKLLEDVANTLNAMEKLCDEEDSE